MRTGTEKGWSEISEKIPAVVFGFHDQLAFYWIVVQINKVGPHFFGAHFGCAAERAVEQRPSTAADIVELHGVL